MCVCCMCGVNTDCDCSWKPEISIGMSFSHLHIYEDRVSLSCKLEVHWLAWMGDEQVPRQSSCLFTSTRVKGPCCTLGFFVVTRLFMLQGRHFIHWAISQIRKMKWVIIAKTSVCDSSSPVHLSKDVMSNVIHSKNMSSWYTSCDLWFSLHRSLAATLGI